MVTSKQMFGLLVGAVVACAASGCESRNLGWGETEFACWDLWECNPDRDCGEMVPCVQGFCQPALGPVLVECPYGDCVTDDECVVAQPYQCCNGCPQVSRRADLPSMTCFYDGATQPGPTPLECEIDCGACELCFPQPLGARCELGRCVPTVEGCPTEGATGLSEITTAALLTNPETYDGNAYRIGGTILPWPVGCDGDCPSYNCCARDSVLDGLVRLEGSACSTYLGLWSDDTCDGEFRSEGILAGGEYVLSGTLRWTPSEPLPWALEVVGLEVAQPRAFGGAYEVFVTAVESDASDPTCLPPTLQVGDWGRIYVAEEGGLVRVAAPLFDCLWDFVGTIDLEGWFGAASPVVCPGICDHELDGQITGEMVFAAYTTFDGLCRHEYQFSGQRLDNDHD